MIHKEPLAYLLTFTCYGTWLHGDVRGSVDKDNNQYGEEILPEDAKKEKFEFIRLKHQPVTLTDEQRTVITNVIVDVCQYRQWELLEVNVRTNHTHIVVGAATEPKKMINDFKSYATRRLREAGLFGQDQKMWTRGGSRKYLWDENSVKSACQYVREQ